jgi:hypothetical protein
MKCMIRQIFGPFFRYGKLVFGLLNSGASLAAIGENLVQPLLPLVLTVTLLVLLSPMNTLACACCAERGTHAVTKEEITEYESETISGSRFGPTAQLFLHADTFDNLRASTAEARYGKLTGIRMEPLTGEEFATFADRPAGLWTAVVSGTP